MNSENLLKLKALNFLKMDDVLAKRPSESGVTIDDWVTSSHLFSSQIEFRSTIQLSKICPSNRAHTW